MNLKRNLSQKKESRFSVDDKSMPFQLMRALLKLIPDSTTELVVICIGTDRSTGDSLGPLTGTLLTDRHNTSIHVYGTLNEPIHAMNLEDRLAEIKELHINPFVIAIDACLGRVKSIGNVIIADGPIQPGKALNKDLPSVGDIHISGVVNVSGYMEFFVLQNTRLHVVMQMAKKISTALMLVDNHLTQRKKKIVSLPIKQAENN